MNERVLFVKEFAKALAAHLRGNTSEFTDRRYRDNGCETCGYGADEYQDLDMDQLDAQIDKFAEEFAEKRAMKEKA